MQYTSLLQPPLQARSGRTARVCEIQADQIVGGHSAGAAHHVEHLLHLAANTTQSF